MGWEMTLLTSANSEMSITFGPETSRRKEFYNFATRFLETFTNRITTMKSEERKRMKRKRNRQKRKRKLRFRKRESKRKWSTRRWRFQRERKRAAKRKLWCQCYKPLLFCVTEKEVEHARVTRHWQAFSAWFNICGQGKKLKWCLHYGVNL